MSSITTRQTASTAGDRTGITNNSGPLTNAQIDANFISLHNTKLEVGDAASSNIAGSVVRRDTSGNFEAGAIVASQLTLSQALPVSSGGTGGLNASAARTNLGLSIGSDVQAYDTDLAAIAGLSSTGIITRTGTGAVSTRTISAGTGISVSNGSGVGGNPTITNSGVTSFNGATGAVTFQGAVGGGSDKIFFLNDTVVYNSYTIPQNQNAMTAGPVTITNGKTITVQSGSTWTIV